MAAKRVKKTGVFKVNRDASAAYSNQKKKPLVAREYKITTFSDGTFTVSPTSGGGGTKTKKATCAKKATKKKTSTARKSSKSKGGK